MRTYAPAIQLYTVRDVLTRDFRGTVKSLAAMGYRAVEFAWNYGGLAPAELASFLGELGLATCGMHASLAELLDPASRTYAYAKALGSPFVTTSLADQVENGWDAAIANAGRAGETAASRGFAFTYHNHEHEFSRKKGACALDLLYARTDPRRVGAELDVFFVRQAGEDPASYIVKLKGRVRQIHLKDMASDGRSQIEVGDGILDLQAVFGAAGAAGVEWMIVEQQHDFCKGSSLESARRSLENLQALKFVAPGGGAT